MESLGVVGDLTGGTPSPILFDSRGWPSGTPTSQVEFINMIETVCSAAAVVVDAESEPRMGTFPGLLDSLVIPFHMFFDEDQALQFFRENM